MQSLYFLTFLAALGEAVDPNVQLNYATYQGVASNRSVSSWKGMRFAAPPTGSLRFAAPQPPANVSGVQLATKTGPTCLGPGDTVNSTFSDDCLFLDVYAPSDASRDSKLPVFFYIPGGGYTEIDPADVDGTDLVNAAGNNIVVVISNYRVGPYGFLASQEIANATDASLNNGIKDQIQALKWTHDNIALFGGDPGHVTLGGVSAGGGSIATLLTAYGGANSTLNSMYHAAAAEEPFFPPFFTPTQFQPVYDNFTDMVNCSGPDSLACLRGLPVAELQKANIPLTLPGASSPPLFTWSPSIDGSLVQDVTYSLFKAGKFNRVPTIFGDDANGGSEFLALNNYSIVPSEESVNSFLTRSWPTLTKEQLNISNTLYTSQNVPQLASGQAEQKHGPYYNILCKVYDDISVRCPSAAMNTAMSRAGLATCNASGSASPPTWSYVYNITNPRAPKKAALGSTHGEESSAIFGPGSLQRFDATNFTQPQIKQLQGYWTSFIRFYDPNAARNAGDPSWPAWTADNRQQLWFEGATNETHVLRESALQQLRCDYWVEQGASLLQ